MMADEAPARFKYAGFSGPHPTLVVACPTCLSPIGHYCNGPVGRPTDRPHDERKAVAGTLPETITEPDDEPREEAVAIGALLEHCPPHYMRQSYSANGWAAIAEAVLRAQTLLGAQEFVKGYAGRSGITHEEFFARRYVVTCGPEHGCDDEQCPGFAAVTHDSFDLSASMYGWKIILPVGARTPSPD